MEKFDIFKKSYIRAFVISFIAVFLMVALPRFGLSPKFNLVNPLPKNPDSFDKVQVKLEQKESKFKLNKTSGFLIRTTKASSDFEMANGYAVIDFDSGEVLAEKNLSKQIPIASITKVMTAVVALDLVSKDELFTVSERAANTEPTKIALNGGDQLTLEELLNALLLSSANDCAVVIKEGIDQRFGQGSFIRAMNAKVEFLNLKNTHFENPAGFDGSAHFSSPEDVAVLSQYALTNYPLISEIVSKNYSELFSNSNHPRYEYLNNWNGLMGVYPGVAGVKIGNTENALHTTSVLAERLGHKILVVLLGAPGVMERDLWASELLDLGFESAFGLEPVKITEEQLKEKYATWKYSN